MTTTETDLGLSSDGRYLQSLIYGLIISTAILSLIVCSLRLYTRAFIVNVFGLDDIAVCVALIITQVFNGIAIAVVYHGEGRHFAKVSSEDRAIWLKLYYVAMCMYLYVSFAILDIRLFVLAFQCDPPRAAYDLTITNGTCYSQFKIFQITLYQAVLIFVSDVIILVAPMVILCGLNMPTRKIIALMAIFGSGIIACISPVVRFSTLGYLREGTEDLTYDSASSLYWMVIEFNLGLVAGSLSSLRPLPFFRRFGSTTNSRYKVSAGDTPHELRNVSGNEARSGKKKSLSMGMGTTIMQDSANESQERIIHMAKSDYGRPHI
ncbi:hypothetical protein N7457_006829 [Penicillium paradoxum]|uniref:uncharacterized protein n=1 Tax=Penicillium paradoxum TaxID=176176 RepID=UPI002547995B|nr:uncharacterized protein N7457_006829 [Penicillium paradoxum]KAJ5779109.1 hypothetical protein N7457_006829 [Penicillium paradoxum]